MNGLGDNQQLYLDNDGSLPFLRQRIALWAKDPAAKLKILLNGKEMIYAIPGIDCNYTIQVTVSSRPKISMS